MRRASQAGAGPLSPRAPPPSPPAAAGEPQRPLAAQPPKRRRKERKTTLIGSAGRRRRRLEHPASPLSLPPRTGQRERKASAYRQRSGAGPHSSCSRACTSPGCTPKVSLRAGVATATSPPPAASLELQSRGGGTETYSTPPPPVSGIKQDSMQAGIGKGEQPARTVCRTRKRSQWLCV